MNIFKKSILLKFLIGTIVPVILCLCVLLFSIFNLVKTEVEGSNINNLTANSQKAAYQVENFLSQYTTMTQAIAENTQVKKLLEEVTMETYIMTNERLAGIKTSMANVLEKDAENILSIWVADFDSSQAALSDGYVTDDTWDVTTRAWYTALLERNLPTFSAPYIDVTTGELVVTAVSPVCNASGEILGAVGVDIALENLEKIMAGYSLGNTGFFTFISAEGAVIYDKDTDNIMKNIKEIGLSDKIITAFGNQDEGYLTYEKDGESMHGYYSSIGDTGWSVLSSLPEKEFYEDYNLLRKISLLIFVIVLIVLSAVIVLISKSIIRPLKRLSLSANQIADGELGAQVDTRTVDETGQVADGLSRTVVKLREYIDYIDEISSILEEMAQGNLIFELKQDYTGEFSKIKIALLNIQKRFIKTFSEISSSAEKVADGSSQLAMGAQQLSQGSMQQASSVEQLLATILEISEEIKKNAENANLASDISTESEREVERGNRQMTEMILAMEEIRNASNQIGHIIKAIDDIAFQTNILALNAAVEAARAGEAGKGFAVVADEVRNLAAKSGEAAKDTTALIETAIAAVENGTKIVDETAKSLEKIVVNAKKSAAVIDDISAAGTNQADSMGHVTTGVEQISTVVQMNSATSQETAAASEQLSGQANILKGLIEQFKIQ